MQLRSGIVFGSLATALALTQGATVDVGATARDDPPSAGQVTFAREVSDLLLNELVAALFQEFNETTPQNVAHGTQAISLTSI